MSIAEMLLNFLTLTMRHLFTIILLCLASIGYGQIRTDSLHTGKPSVLKQDIRICVPSRAGLIENPPLYIIKFGTKEYRSNKLGYGRTIDKLLDPTAIASITIQKTLLLLIPTAKTLKGAL